MKKVIRYVDEDTLEIMEKVIDDGVEELPEDEANNITALFEQALPCKPDDFAQRYKKYKDAKAEFDAVYEAFKVNLIELHKVKPNLPKSVIIGGAKLTYVSASTRKTIDSKKLKEEEPSIAEKYTKITNVNPTIRLEGTI